MNLTAGEKLDIFKIAKHSSDCVTKYHATIKDKESKERSKRVSLMYNFQRTVEKDLGNTKKELETIFMESDRNHSHRSIVERKISSLKPHEDSKNQLTRAQSHNNPQQSLNSSKVKGTMSYNVVDEAMRIHSGDSEG